MYKNISRNGAMFKRILLEFTNLKTVLQKNVFTCGPWCGWVIKGRNLESSSDWPNYWTLLVMNTLIL